MVRVAEGSSVKGSPQQVGALALMLREGQTHNSRIPVIDGLVPSSNRGSVNDTTPASYFY